MGLPFFQPCAKRFYSERSEWEIWKCLFFFLLLLSNIRHFTFHYSNDRLFFHMVVHHTFTTFLNNCLLINQRPSDAIILFSHHVANCKYLIHDNASSIFSVFFFFSSCGIIGSWLRCFLSFSSIPTSFFLTVDTFGENWAFDKSQPESKNIRTHIWMEQFHVFLCLTFSWFLLLFLLSFSIQEKMRCIYIFFSLSIIR